MCMSRQCLLTLGNVMLFTILINLCVVGLQGRNSFKKSLGMKLV